MTAITPRRPRIVFLGAGSIQFTPRLMADFVHQSDLWGSTICLVDLDARRLAVMHDLAGRLVEAGEADYEVVATTDRATVLPGADVVILSVEVERFPTWEEDRRIPSVLGVPQALGENGGPGGLFHGLRQIPPIVEICEDVASLCPNALVVNLSNPLSRICQAIRDCTAVRCVGLCHEIAGGNRYLARLLELDVADLRVTAAGINHFTWYLEIRHRLTGEDLYPTVRDRARAGVPDDRLLVSDLLRLTGWLCVTNDSHAGEYLSGGHRWRSAWAPTARPHDFYPWYRSYVEGLHDEVMAVVTGAVPPRTILEVGSGEVVVGLVSDVVHGRTAEYDALNLPNDGLVANLAPQGIVEVPGRVVDGRIAGRPVGAMPDVLSEWCRRQMEIHRLTAAAAVTGDRRLALAALLLDPAVPDPQTAERLLDAMLLANRRYLPRFFA